MRRAPPSPTNRAPPSSTRSGRAVPPPAPGIPRHSSRSHPSRPRSRRSARRRSPRPACRRSSTPSAARCRDSASSARRRPSSASTRRTASIARAAPGRHPMASATSSSSARTAPRPWRARVASAPSAPSSSASGPIDRLAAQSDEWLNAQGRLIEPLYRREGAAHYEPISWDEAFHHIGKVLRALPTPDRRHLLHLRPREQ